MTADRPAGDMLEQGREPRGGWRPGRRTAAAVTLAGLLVAALSVGALVERRQHHASVQRPAVGPLDWGSHGSLRGDKATVTEARRVWASHDPSTRDSSRVLFAGSRDGVRVVLLIAPTSPSAPGYATAAITGPAGKMRLARTARASLTPTPEQLSVVLGTSQRAVLLVVTSPGVQQVSYVVSTPSAPEPSVNGVAPTDQSVLTSVPGIWSVTELDVYGASGTMFEGTPGLEDGGAPPAPRLLVQTLQEGTAVQLRAGVKTLCVVALSPQDPALPEVRALECTPRVDLAGQVTPVRMAFNYAYGLGSARVESVRVAGHGEPATLGSVGDIDPANSTRGFLAPLGTGFPGGELIFVDRRGQELVRQPLA